MRSNTPVKSIVWLHLSDLHLCEPKTGWDAHRVLRPLIKNLQQLERRHGLLPQLMFFTGDAAFGNYGSGPGSTLAEQYQEVETFLTEIRQAFSTEIPKENLFLVPGNHDVDRSEVTDQETKWIENEATADTVTQLIKDNKKSWKGFMDRLKTYRQFLQSNGYTHLLDDPDRLIYSQIREFHGIKLGIGGFNSAWNCSRDKEKGKLWLAADWQNGTIVKSLQKQQAELKIALIHHPPGWFVEQEGALLRSQMERDFDFFLHGHEHQDWVNSINDHHVRIAGAACYEGSGEENGYNFVRLNLETGDMEIWLRKYDEHGGGWIPRIIAGKTNNDGLWRIPSIPCLEPLKCSIPNLSISPKELKLKPLPNTTMKPISLFYSYAHKDEHLRKQLEIHLSNLKHQGKIQAWHDREIMPGSSWADEIDENLEKADIILLLISPDFMASDYCYGKEMKRALERHYQGVAKAVPVLLRPTDFEDSRLAKLQGLPTPFDPISEWQSQDAGFLTVVKGLRKLINAIQARQNHSEQENQAEPEESGFKDSVFESDTELTFEVSNGVRQEVREEIDKLMQKLSLNEMEKVLSKKIFDQSVEKRLEIYLVPLDSEPFPIIETIDNWHTLAKDWLDQVSAQQPKKLKDAVNFCKEIFEWLLRLAVPDSWVRSKPANHAHSMKLTKNISETHSIWAEVGHCSLIGRRPDLEFDPRNYDVSSKNQIPHQEFSKLYDPMLESGILNEDRLKTVLEMLWKKITKTDNFPTTKEMIENLPMMLTRRAKDKERYHITIPFNQYSEIAKSPIWSALSEIFINFGVFVCGTGSGDRVLIVPENTLLIAIKEFYFMLNKYNHD